MELTAKALKAVDDKGLRRALASETGRGSEGATLHQSRQLREICLATPFGTLGLLKASTSR